MSMSITVFSSHHSVRCQWEIDRGMVMSVKSKVHVVIVAVVKYGSKFMLLLSRKPSSTWMCSHVVRMWNKRAHSIELVTSMQCSMHT